MELYPLKFKVSIKECCGAGINWHVLEKKFKGIGIGESCSFPGSREIYP